MAKYKVDCGSYGRGGMVFKRGDVVTCSEDLVKTFPNSFVKINSDEELPPAVSPEDVFELDAGPDETLSEKSQESPVPADAEVDDSVPEKRKKTADSKASQAPDKAKGKASKDIRGKDVTVRFPHAKDEDYLVFRRGSRFYVFDTDDPNKVLNEKSLKKAEVDGFVDQLLEI